MTTPITYAGNPLDRASHLRSDTAWLKARLRDSKSRLLPLFDLKPFLIDAKGPKPSLGWLRPGLIEASWSGTKAVVFLGLDGDIAHFAVDVSGLADPSLPGGVLDGFNGSFPDLRATMVAGGLSGPDSAIIAQARALLDWHKRHPFCAQCGKPTDLSEGGYKRLCGGCGAEHFPRTDPVVIMLATRDDMALLGRGKNFPGQMYSALAGFVEPGETIEEAVAREIKEEAGIEVGAVRYVATQPWPFPMSLMIGCMAHATSTKITIDESELADARWIDRATLAQAMKGEGGHDFFVPPKFAIAHHLIRAFVDEA